jgi:hypothetical protein
MHITQEDYPVFSSKPNTLTGLEPGSAPCRQGGAYVGMFLFCQK